MAWKRSDSLIGSQLSRHGLGGAVQAGKVCQEAERLYPGQFLATAIVGDILKVTVTPEQVIPFRLIEGKLLDELKAFAKPVNLPVPRRIRLTIAPISDRV